MFTDKAVSLIVEGKEMDRVRSSLLLDVSNNFCFVTIRVPLWRDNETKMKKNNNNSWAEDFLIALYLREYAVNCESCIL